MSTLIRTKNGKKIVLLNPAEKAKRYARQMKAGCVRETGEKLTKDQMAFRVGYLSARKDSANAYNSKNKKTKTTSKKK